MPKKLSSPPTPTGLRDFIATIHKASPNGEWVKVQHHPNGDWSVADESPPTPTAEHDGLDMDAAGRRLIAEHQRIWPGDGWPALNEAKRLVLAALAATQPGGGA